MTGTRLPDQNNEQRSYLVARVLPTPRWTTTSVRPWTTPAGPSASACAKTRRTDGPQRRREDHQGEPMSDAGHANGGRGVVKDSRGQEVRGPAALAVPAR